MPKLSDYDLQQMDPIWVSKLSVTVVYAVLNTVLDEFRRSRDRENQTPANSSRPPSSMPPWRRASAAAHDAEPDDDLESEDSALPDQPGGDTAGASAPAQAEQAAAAAPSATPSTTPSTAPASKQAWASRAAPKAAKRAGRRPGAPGHGREQRLLPTRTEQHRPLCCAACLQPLPPDGKAVAWTGWDTLELVATGAAQHSGATLLGVRIEVTRHLLMQQDCACCGHTSRAQASRAEHDALWPGVDISQQRLLGPRLAATVVYLCLRMRLPRRKVSELMWELLGLQLSPALIDQTVHQSARSVAPLEEPLAQQLEQAVLLHADETSWSEAGAALWLWVLCCCHTVLYLIGPRTKEMFDNALCKGFAGNLMTDGYAAYRNRLQRLRCWAHLLRKLEGVAESTDRRAAQPGGAMLTLFEQLMRAVFEARDRLAQPPPAGAGPPATVPAISHAHLVEQLCQLCEHHRDSAHEALRAIAREFLNDWDVIMRPLSDPRLPLTNNAAERQLRHYVIARRISYGTRTAVGSHSVALLASIIDTCRLRRASATDLLARAIHAARMGLPAPALPPIPADLLSPIVA